MANHQRLIDDIVNALANGHVEKPDRLATLAADYTLAVSDVNGRLQEAGQLLRQGLRSEALQICEIEPKVLDQAATLDFPQLPEWQELLDLHRIPAAPNLLLDTAGDLNEAYAQERPLAGLMRRHRLLALMRAPLADRLATMREIARRDAGNPVWDEDLRTYEKAHVKQLANEAERVFRERDEPALAVIEAELSGTKWLESPSKSLVGRVCERLQQVRKESARQELDRLEPLLNEAFASLDPAEGRSLRDRWTKAVQVAKLDDGDRLHDLVAPALDWLARLDREESEQRQWQQAVAALERSLDGNPTLAELERVLFACERFEAGLPAPLAQRCAARRQSLQLQESRRRRLLIGSAIVAVGLLVAGVTTGMLVVRHRSEVDAHSATLQQLLAAGRLHDAQALLISLERTSPRVAGSPKFRALAADLNQRVQQEADRARRFQESLARAVKAGVESPDRKSLAQAESLVKLPAERERLTEFQSRLAVRDRQRQQVLDDGFLARLAEFERKVSILEQELGELKLTLSQRPTELADAFRQCEAASDKVSQTTRLQATPVRLRLERLVRTHAERVKQQQLIDLVAQSVGNLPNFREALKATVAGMPDSARTADLQRALQEETLWEGIEAWNRLLASRAGLKLDELTAQQARELLTESSELDKQWADLPQAVALRKIKPHLEAIARRKDEAGTLLKDELKTLLSDSLMQGLFMVQVLPAGQEPPAPIQATLDAPRYYLKKQPTSRSFSQKEDGSWEFPDNMVTVRNIADFELQEKAATVAVRRIVYVGPAPQSVWATQTLERLDKRPETDWDNVFCEVLSDLLSEQRSEVFRRLDPILTLILLQKVMTTASAGSECLRQALARHQEILAAPDIDTSVNWMDPVSESAEQSRRLAANLLTRLPDWADTLRQVSKLQAEFREGWPALALWWGWLHRDSDGAWKCSGRDGKESGKLYVMCRRAASLPPTLEPLGSIRDGRVELDRTATVSFVEGRPVYMLQGRAVASVATP